MSLNASTGAIARRFFSLSWDTFPPLLMQWKLIWRNFPCHQGRRWVINWSMLPCNKSPWLWSIPVQCYVFHLFLPLFYLLTAVFTVFFLPFFMCANFSPSSQQGAACVSVCWWTHSEPSCTCRAIFRHGKFFFSFFVSSSGSIDDDEGTFIFLFPAGHRERQHSSHCF